MEDKQRLFIYAKDIADFTGCSERTAQKILQRIRKALGKEKGDFVSIAEFCSQTRTDEQMVHKIINNPRSDIKKTIVIGR
jgi:transcriptional antiterminator